ncbi:hypothetical protein KJ819_02020 [Patescibacteria group bacterium]|nr:hypothetical protein [Patescibacteria group bacterium]MBU1500939.1 hypothetical protein [Patescibacteria group bacterium]MBU2194481.1 hypothetical protein [Patescibacteria group bacterium]
MPALHIDRQEHFVGDDCVDKQMAFAEQVVQRNIRTEITGFHFNGAANPPYADVFYRECPTQH